MEYMFLVCKVRKFWICSKLLICPFTRKDASEANSDYNDGFVTLHDIPRELAMHQSSKEPEEERPWLILNISGNNLPKRWTEKKQKLINARLLSISTGWHISSLAHYVNYIIMSAYHTVHNSFCRWIFLMELVQHSSTQSWGFSSEFSDTELHLTWICGENGWTQGFDSHELWFLSCWNKQFSTARVSTQF